MGKGTVWVAEKQTDCRDRCAVITGMTIKFFGLFFYERCGLSPVAVSLLATVAPFLVSGASFAAQWGSKWCAIPLDTANQSIALAFDHMYVAFQCQQSMAQGFWAACSEDMAHCAAAFLSSKEL